MAGSMGKGNYYEPMPLDFELLKRMPDEGSVVGYHVLGLTVKHVTKELNKDLPDEAKLTTQMISARIRSMHVEGHCVKVKVMGGEGGYGWQRTAKGKKFLDDNTEKKPLSLVKKEAEA